MGVRCVTTKRVWVCRAQTGVLY